MSSLFRPALLLFAALLAFGLNGRAQTSVQITFLPPPLENATYSLGVYEAKSGKMVRRLHEIAPESAFIVGLNGLITRWDGRDDAGKAVPAGKYAARGYAVGPLKVTGVDILGNDWAADDETLRLKHVEAIQLVAPDSSLAVLATMANGAAELLRILPDGRLLWRRKLAAKPANPALTEDGENLLVWDGSHGAVGIYQSANGDDAETSADHSVGPAKTSVAGKAGTSWEINQDTEDQTFLVQKDATGGILRRLATKTGDPLFRAVSASTKEDKLYLLEESLGWQRVRGLSWVETKEEDGKQVSTWKTFFERNIREPDAALGLDTTAAPVEISLVENPLEPGKPQKMKLAGSFDEKGSYLTSSDGLHLRQISQRANLVAVKLTKAKAANNLTFFESDGAAWDEFSIEGARNMMAFDAGEFEMTATGEKPVTEKAPEPAPDL